MLTADTRNLSLAASRPLIGCKQTLEPLIFCQQTLEPLIDCQQTLEPLIGCQQTLEPLIGCQQTLEPLIGCQQTPRGLSLAASRHQRPLIGCKQTPEASHWRKANQPALLLATNLQPSMKLALMQSLPSMPLIGWRQTREDSKGRMLTSRFLNLFTCKFADTNLPKKGSHCQEVKLFEVSKVTPNSKTFSKKIFLKEHYRTYILPQIS